MEALNFNMTKLPVWLHLWNVPLELFIQDGLSCIASVVGNPLYMDRITASQKRLAYAKVCFEIKVTTKIPSSNETVRPDGSLWPVDVEVPWSPQKFLTCCIFGHFTKNCPKNPSISVARVWVPIKSKSPSNGGKDDLVIDKINEASIGSKADARSKVAVGSSIKHGSDKEVASGRASSVSRFAILNETIGVEDKEENTKTKDMSNLISGVFALMESIKEQIANKKALTREPKEVNKDDQCITSLKEEKGKN
ncbi:hypothetical protein PTKIN_Ptkin01aG0104800 [Pterospermum kingtungense]